MAEKEETQLPGTPEVPLDDLHVEETPEVEAKEEEQPPQSDPVEEEARAGGWLPKEEFFANPANAGKKWRSAELFLELTPLYEKLDSLHKQNKTLNQGLKAFAEHNKRIEVSAYNRAKAELMRERKVALEEQDFVKAEEIRDQIDALPKPVPPPVPDLPPEPNPGFLAWKDQNKWYANNADAKMWADTYGTSLIQGGTNPQEMLRQVSEKARQVFPHLFVNPKRESAPSVETGSTKGKSTGFSLTSEETAIMNRLIASGAPITRDEYIAQIKRTRGA